MYVVVVVVVVVLAREAVCVCVQTEYESSSECPYGIGIGGGDLLPDRASPSLSITLSLSASRCCGVATISHFQFPPLFHPLSLSLSLALVSSSITPKMAVRKGRAFDDFPLVLSSENQFPTQSSSSVRENWKTTVCLASTRRRTLESFEDKRIMGL